MDERARSCLLSSRSKLEQDIKASYIMDHMVSDGVLNTDEEEKVEACTTRKEKAVALLNLILKKDNYAYISFYNALLREGYGDLASMLQQDLPLISPAAEKRFLDGGTPFVQTILCEGGVPQRPVVFVCRPELINRIREKLYKLENGFGWVAVFGMAGFGKSVLTAEAVRDEQLLKACFPGGVHWLSVGQLDKAGLLVKMQSLCYRLDQDSQSGQRSPVTIEEARDRLRFLMVRKYPRSLLILDDIWDSVVLKAFDIQCRVLFSTRDRSVTDSVSGKKYEVSVDHGLEDDKALEVLALFVNKKVSALPVQTRSIVHECKGSPLVVSLIGALLREFPDRWQYYLRQLQNKQFKRIRKTSSYDYDALDQAMSVSIDVLHEDRKEYYKDLSVLEKDVKVPAKVLSILWDLEPEEAEDILQEFVNKSLLFRDCNKRPYQYYLHDLQLDFLTEQNRYRLKDLHSKMVNLYQNHYKKGHPTAADEECMYWFRYLAYHMAHGNLHEELYSLMFSLDWVKAKAQMMGPASLINDYVVYKDILDEENSTVRDHFQEFLSLNGHHLSQKPFPDVVQMGLCQPDSSEVYRQARLKAEQETKKGAFYLEWINKSSLESLSRLIVRPHKGAVYYACFSHNWQQIASCGSDKTLQVFKSQTGEKLLEVQAHDDDVLCCAFSPDDKLIATCSADKKIKVWNSQNGNLLRTYDEHSEQVNHCQFTNTSSKILLATCSNDNFIKLWNTNRPGSQNTMFGHGGPVNHCCFSPDDQYLASCSSDGTLKLWEVHTANEWKSIDIMDFFPNLTDEPKESEEVVRCSAWSSDGTRIMAAAKNMVFVFDIESATLLSEIKTGRHSTIQSCDFCPSSQLVAIALSHYTVELWDLESNKKVADCSGHLSWVHCVRFSPDGSVLLSSSDDQTVRLWETKKVHPSSAVSLKRDSDVLFHHNEISVIAPDNRKRLQLRNGKTGEVIYQSEEQESRIRCCCLSKDPQAAVLAREDGTVKAGVMSPKQVLRSIGWWTLQLLTLQQSLLTALGLENGTVKVLEMPSGNALCTLTGHTKTVLHCQFTPDGQTLITCSEDTTVRVWDWKSLECKVLKGHSERVKRFRLLDSSRLLSWSFDGTVKVWDIVTGEMIQDYFCHQGAVLSCDVSPNGNTFSSVSADKSAKIWSFDSTSALHILNGHKDCVRSCRFSWDNQCLATGDDNGEIRIWRVFDGSLLHICARENKDSLESLHGGWITDLHFSPDSKMLVSTGGYIKWWNVEKGESLQTFYTTGTNLKGIHVSPDFKTFVTIDNIGVLYILRKVG
ncbi:apoptotic protease-activating factor 1-like isoform X2 [Acipenser ruthenus]|uniref:apoptotic protease-activating factor 1-like isoform X2 n=1 Tax=Acipenser ruthenus TaxID=7906 RepID=UPI0027426F38|nr:apoptotic protease-activating factor 1-like isoform X2 [Acipenser ruthenus]